MVTNIAFDYSLAANIPGADTNSYVLFSTVDAGIPKGACSGAGIKRYVLRVDNPENGAVELWWSPDHGTTWIRISNTAVNAPAADTYAEVDLLIEGYPDWKVEWKNGGVAQTGWTLFQSLTDERADATAT